MLLDQVLEDTCDCYNDDAELAVCADICCLSEVATATVVVSRPLCPVTFTPVVAGTLGRGGTLGGSV